jgi:hypothetical protein
MIAFVQRVPVEDIAQTASTSSRVQGLVLWGHIKTVDVRVRVIGPVLYAQQRSTVQMVSTDIHVLGLAQRGRI